MTIQKLQKEIEEELGGHQIDPAKIRDYIENPDAFTEDFTPTMWLFNFTEIEMPEKELGGVYYIYVKKEIEYEGDFSSPKGCLIFLRSIDGINATKAYAAFPFEASDEEIDRINKWLRNRFPNK